MEAPNITLGNFSPVIHHKVPSTDHLEQERWNLTTADTSIMPNFPTMKSRELLRILQQKPLSCSIMRTRGSHRTLRTPSGRTFRYAHHDAKELSGYQVRDVLMNDLGLTEKEALEVLR